MTGQSHAASTIDERRPDRYRYPRVKGHCPKGCGETLFLGEGGFVTCSWIKCPDPCAAGDLLERAHLVQLALDAFGKVRRV